MRAFQKFRTNPQKVPNILWQESDTLWPYECTQCHRTFEKGGLRYLGSSLMSQSYNAKVILCPECHSGGNPNRQRTPKYAERRTSFD